MNWVSKKNFNLLGVVEIFRAHKGYVKKIQHHEIRKISKSYYPTRVPPNLRAQIPQTSKNQIISFSK